MSVSMSRKWAIVMIVSVALNLFLAAVIATAWVKMPRHFNRGFATAPLSMPWAVRVLGQDTRPMAREIFHERFPEFSDVRRTLLDDSRNLAAILKEPQFDRIKFEAALTELRDHTNLAVTANHAAMAEFAEKITPVQRLELAETIENGVRRRERRYERWRERREKRERDQND
jgi:uncharacterized membrane protein